MQKDKTYSTLSRRFALLLVFLFALTMPLSANTTLNLEINHKAALQKGDIRIIDGHSYVKADAIAKSLHFDYFWQESTQTLFLSQVKNRQEIILYFEGDGKSLQKNDSFFKDVDKMNLSAEQKDAERKLVLDRGFSFDVTLEKVKEKSNYIVVDGELFLPLRKIAEPLKYHLDWDAFSKTIMLRTVDKALLPKRDSLRVNYSEEDFLLMAKLVQVEARSGSLNKKLAVANVILNRVESPRFPNTIKEVIYAQGQFPPVYRSTFAAEVPSNEAVLAVKKALYHERAEFNGVRLPNDVLFFNNAPFSNKSDADFFGLIEGDYFYR